MRWWRLRRKLARVPDKISYALRRRFGVAIIMGGTDCDGMRWARVSYHWTREEAEAYLDHVYEWADGPMRGEIVTCREGREYDPTEWADGRDRFAERMGY